MKRDNMLELPVEIMLKGSELHSWKFLKSLQTHDLTFGTFWIQPTEIL